MAAIEKSVLRPAAFARMTRLEKAALGRRLGTRQSGIRATQCKTERIKRDKVLFIVIALHKDGFVGLKISHQCMDINKALLADLDDRNGSVFDPTANGVFGNSQQ